MVVIAVIMLTLPAIFAILYAIMQQQSRILALTEVKRQGTYVVDILTTLVRNNASGIYDSQGGNQICSYGTTSPYTNTLYFKDKQSNWFWFDPSSQKIASRSSLLASPADLINTSKTRIDSFSSSCSVSGYNPPLVTFAFDISYKKPDGSADTTLQIHFQPTVKLSNY